MAISRSDVVAALSRRDAADLLAVLELARAPARGAVGSAALAERVAAALWWSYATPLGLVARSVALDEIVDHVARRLGLAAELPVGDAWARLHALTARLELRSRGVALEDLDPAVRARLGRSWWPTAGLATGSAGSAAAMAGGRAIRWASGTLVGRVLPYVPRVGPWVRGAYRVGGVAAALGGPVALALAVLAANDALGTNYHRLVPLLLGVGSLGPDPVREADEVDPAGG
jgi:hypothetical protein